MVQDSERGNNAIKERPEEDDCDSCEGFEGAEAEAGRPIRRSLSRCLDVRVLHLPTLSHSVPFSFVKHFSRLSSLIIFSHSSPYDHLLKNPTALLFSLKSLHKAHFSQKI